MLGSLLFLEVRWFIVNLTRVAEPAGGGNRLYEPVHIPPDRDPPRSRSVEREREAPHGATIEAAYMAAYRESSRRIGHCHVQVHAPPPYPAYSCMSGLSRGAQPHFTVQGSVPHGMAMSTAPPRGSRQISRGSRQISRRCPPTPLDLARSPRIAQRCAH